MVKLRRTRRRTSAPLTKTPQVQALDEVAAAMTAGTVSSTDAYQTLLAIGPIRGSFGDLRGGPLGGCRHLAWYPGCPGGCASKRIS